MTLEISSSIVKRKSHITKMLCTAKETISQEKSQSIELEKNLHQLNV